MSLKCDNFIREKQVTICLAYKMVSVLFHTSNILKGLPYPQKKEKAFIVRKEISKTKMPFAFIENYDKVRM